MPAAPRLLHRAEPVPGVDLRVWRYDALACHRSPEGAHSGFELSWVDEGQCSFRVGTRESCIGPGSALVIPRGFEHVTAFRGAMRGGAIEIDGDRFDEAAEMLGAGACRAPLVIEDGGRIVDLASMIVDESRSGEPGACVVEDGLFEALLVTVLRRLVPVARGRSPIDPRIARAMELVRTHLDRSLSNRGPREGCRDEPLSLQPVLS